MTPFQALLGAASQRVEFLLLEWFGTPWIHALLEEWKKHERGALPGEKSHENLSKLSKFTEKS